MAVKKIKSLTNLEMAKIDKFSTFMEIENLKATNLELEYKNIQLQAQLQLNDLIRKKDVIAEGIKSRQAAHNVFMKNIATRCQIKGKWSFNPETGEINKE